MTSRPILPLRAGAVPLPFPFAARAELKKNEAVQHATLQCGPYSASAGDLRIALA